jgi:hypothetical protein
MQSVHGTGEPGQQRPHLITVVLRAITIAAAVFYAVFLAV